MKENQENVLEQEDEMRVQTQISPRFSSAIFHTSLCPQLVLPGRHFLSVSRLMRFPKPKAPQFRTSFATPSPAQHLSKANSNETSLNQHEDDGFDDMEISPDTRGVFRHHAYLYEKRQPKFEPEVQQQPKKMNFIE